MTLDTIISRNGKARPLRIGLALGSGVARGWVHIGVLRALDRLGLRPDVISGTSIGALVGGCYAADRLDVLEDWARSLTKYKMVSYIDVQWGGGGLVRGTKLMQLMEEHLGNLTIEQLPRSFTAIASDLSTGREVWLNEGSLITALRASFSLPGVFPPVMRDHAWLVDGALVNPVPVSVLMAKGCDITMAVNLNSDLMGKNRPNGSDVATVAGFDPLQGVHSEDGLFAALKANVITSLIFRRAPNAPSLFGAMAGALNIFQDRLTRARLAADSPEVQFEPEVGHIGLFEFDRADEMIAEGARAVERALPQIRDALRIRGASLPSDLIAPAP